jgi:hypothetical protein
MSFLGRMVAARVVFSNIANNTFEIAETSEQFDI